MNWYYNKYSLLTKKKINILKWKENETNYRYFYLSFNSEIVVKLVKFILIKNLVISFIFKLVILILILIPKFRKNILVL